MASKQFVVSRRGFLKLATARAAASGPAKNLKAGKQGGSLDAQAFVEIMKGNPGSLHLVDVRDAGEFAAGPRPARRRRMASASPADRG